MAFDSQTSTTTEGECSDVGTELVPDPREDVLDMEVSPEGKPEEANPSEEWFVGREEMSESLRPR